MHLRLIFFKRRTLDLVIKHKFSTKETDPNSKAYITEFLNFIGQWAKIRFIIVL